MGTTTVSARIDSDVKRNAESVLDALGLSHSAVISALYSQIALRKAVPFEISIPSGRPALTLKQIRDALRPLAASYGVERMVLFGSYARGEADANSDVDLRIDPGEARGLAIGGLQQEAQAALGVNVDMVTTGSLSGSFLERISPDEVVIYER